MKNKLLRFAALVMSLVMAAALLASCGKQDSKGGKTPSGNNSGSGSGTSSDAEYLSNEELEKLNVTNEKPIPKKTENISLKAGNEYPLSLLANSRRQPTGGY